MATDKFYDIHFHCMDLSHANLTAFIDRVVDGIHVDSDDVKNVIRKMRCFRWVPVVPAILGWFAKPIVGLVKRIIKEKDLLKGAKKARNLLSFMENSIDFDFLIMEYFLMNDRPDHNPDFTPPVIDGNGFTIEGKNYKKIVLCPLVMDFGYKNLTQEGVFYNIPPQKPVARQVTDLFNAIHTYYNNKVTITTSAAGKENGGKPFTKFVVEKIDFNPSAKMFEIYPFFGINPDNYEYQKVSTMLTKYFSDFSGNDSPQERYKKLYSAMGGFGGDINNHENCQNIFAGIKVYPPLGYDPWPDDCTDCADGEINGKPCNCNKAKVKLIYTTCVEKNIPMITHCSNGGFKADPDYLKLTEPGGKWAKVLERYPTLKIDFAHFGVDDEKWTETIISHILKPGSNVYTDFSCNTDGDAYYKVLDELVADCGQPDILSERILFGTDFMINMLWIESYNSYLKCFQETPSVKKFKNKFCNENSERFLFGGSLE